MSSIASAIVTAAQAAGVDPALALEVAQAESGMNQSAVSPTGAIGIFQLEPATAAMLGVDPTDAQQNIQGGVQYLAMMLSQFSAQGPAAALAAYNWGPTNVAKIVNAYQSNWFNYIPSSVQAYVTGILGAVASEYSATLSPGPAIADGVQSVTASAGSALGSVPAAVWAIGAAAVMVFLVAIVRQRRELEAA
jgi:soluble lytic murein transglycosylase-like protein